MKELSNGLSQLVHEVSFHPKKRLEIVSGMSREKAAALLLRLTKHIRRDIMDRLPDATLIAILEHLDPDEVTDMVRLISQNRQEKIVKSLNEELRRDVELLAQE